MTGEVAKAFFEIVSAPGAGERIDVHFNPESLEVQITNTLDNKGKSNKKKQFVSESSAKLSMELTFDTTNTGEDVRRTTAAIAGLMEPEDKVPPTVRFSWGAYAFQGMVDSYKESLVFFSADGVPLRATVSLTMTSQEDVFAEGSDEVAEGLGERLSPDAVEAPPDPSTGAAGAGGSDPAAARGVGAANGLENLRDPGLGSLSLPLGGDLLPPVAFASGGAGLGLGAGGGIGLSAGAGIGISGGAGIGISGGAGASAGFGAAAGAGFGVGASAGFGAGAGASAGFSAGASAGFGASASAGFGAGASAGFGASASASFAAGASASAGSTAFDLGSPAEISGPLFGASASAGVTASVGAFAGLQPVAPTATVFAGAAVGSSFGGARSVATDSDATFTLGGAAQVQAGAGLRSDVGASASLGSLIRFEEG